MPLHLKQIFPFNLNFHFRCRGKSRLHFKISSTLTEILLTDMTDEYNIDMFFFRYSGRILWLRFWLFFWRFFWRFFWQFFLKNLLTNLLTIYLNILTNMTDEYNVDMFFFCCSGFFDLWFDFGPWFWGWHKGFVINGIFLLLRRCSWRGSGTSLPRPWFFGIVSILPKKEIIDIINNIAR